MYGWNENGVCDSPLNDTSRPEENVVEYVECGEV